MTRLLPLSLLIVLILTGCSKDAVYRNLYEEMDTQSELQNLHKESHQEKRPKSYDQYKRERQEQLAMKRKKTTVKHLFFTLCYVVQTL